MIFRTTIKILTGVLLFLSTGAFGLKAYDLCECSTECMPLLEEVQLSTQDTMNCCISPISEAPIVLSVAIFSTYNSNQIDPVSGSLQTGIQEYPQAISKRIQISSQNTTLHTSRYENSSPLII